MKPQGFIAFLPLSLKASRPKDEKYPNSLKTLGDHIRARRLDLNLYQKDVARLLGVNEFTVHNWEKYKSGPDVRLLPKIMDFLGYCAPVPRPSFPEKLRAYRTILLGLTYKEFAKKLGVDEGTLLRWEHGDRSPRGDKRSILEQVRLLSKD